MEWVKTAINFTRSLHDNVENMRQNVIDNDLWEKIRTKLVEERKGKYLSGKCKIKKGSI